MPRLKDKLIVITGAGSGIGRETARQVAAEGGIAACLDLTTEVKDTADEIAAAGGRAVAHVADVTDERGLAEVAASLVADHGAIAGLYANAGIPGNGTALSTSRKTWDRVIGVNLTGVWLSMQAVLPSMLENGRGSLVLQASVGGLVGVEGIFPYAAAKGGVVAMAKQTAVDFGPHGIRVNAIAPGTAMTPLVTETFARRVKEEGRGETTEQALARRALDYPIGRLGKVEEIASMAIYLLSDEASFVTGAILPVDGGFTAR